MNYICSKQGKIDKLWGRFIKHLLELEAAGIKVEYIRKGEVILNGKRFKPVYKEVCGKPGENGNHSVIRDRQDCFPDGRNNQPGGVKHGISTSINKKAE